MCRSRRVDRGGLCEECERALSPRYEVRCPRCAVRLGPHVPVKAPCAKCRTSEFAFRSARALFTFEGTVREQIHAAKFGKQWSVGRRLARTFARSIHREHIPEDVSLIVSVPMFWWNRRLRGVNLAEELARALAETHRIEHDPRLLRQLRPMPPQFTLNAAERQRNVTGLFAVRDRGRLDNVTALLVDDVMTTGATASECARLLKRAGAKTVHVAVLARTEPPA